MKFQIIIYLGLIRKNCELKKLGIDELNKTSGLFFKKMIKRLELNDISRKYN